MRRINTLTLWLVLAALLLPLLTLLIPVPAGSSRVGIEFYLYTYVSVATTLSFIAAACLFILGFGEFTAKLKQAYGILCLGLVFYGLAHFQVPILTITNQLESIWTRSGLIALPFLVALISLFWGMRRFARLIGVRSIWSSFWFVLGSSTAAAVGSTFLPHFGPASTEVAFDSSVAFSTWGLGLIIASAILALQVKRTANVTYTNAMAWMFVAFTGVGIVGAHYIMSILVFGDRSEYAESVIVLANYLVAGLVFVRAAYAFNVISDQAVANFYAPRTFFGRSKAVQPMREASSLDIVMYAAQLVSNPRSIEGIMNRVRMITAQYAPDQPARPQDGEVLEKVFLDIEQYLTTKEPVRKFTRESLRSDIVRKLKLNVRSTQTFWSQL